MGGYRQPCKPPRSKPKPLDETRLKELALAYMARFATSTAKLERYLYRKLRERGWEGEAEPDIAEMVSHYADLGYVDDEAYARAKSGSLLRRGYGPRRVNQALGEAGIDEIIREEVGPGEAEERRAVLAMARKRGFGPFGRDSGAGDPDLQAKRREKQIAAMMRAGHRLDSALQMVDARSVEAAEEWAAEADDDDQEA